MRVHNIPMNHASRSLLDDKSTSTTPPPSNSSSSSTTTTTDAAAVHFDSSSLAVTALVLLSALFFLAFFSIYARRFFASSTSDYDADHLPARRRRGRASLALRVGYGHSSAACGLDSTTIRSLPLLSYTSGLKAPADSPGGGCVVCLSEFEEGETVKLIPGCGHLFHPQCIDAWLGDHGSCPLCRSTDVFAPSSKVDDRPYVMERAETRHELQVVVVDGGRTTAAVEEGEGRRKLGGLGRSRSWDCMEVERSASPRRSCSL